MHVEGHSQDLEPLDLKVNADGGFVVRVEGISAEPARQYRLRFLLTRDEMYLIQNMQKDGSPKNIISGNLRTIKAGKIDLMTQIGLFS